MNKVTLKLLELCDYAIVAKDNKLSILGIFDRVYVKQIPAQHGKLFVVGIVEGDRETNKTIKFIIKDPSGKMIIPELVLNAQLGQDGKSNLIAEMNNLPLLNQGIYVIECFDEKILLGKREFIVSLVGGQHERSGQATKKLPN